VTSAKTSGPIRIPRSRRLTLDVLHFHKHVALCAHDRQFDLSRLVALRSRLPDRISWSLLFIKAFGVVAANRPVLRQTYQRWPWPHIYQHSDSVAMLATHRVHQGEPWVFLSRFAQPEHQSLTVLQARLDRYLTEPVTKIFRQQWQLSGLPTMLRRFLWWWTFNISLAKRAHRSGTFFLTTLAGKKVEIQDPPGYLTTNLTYGPLDERNRCRVTMSYDHQLMDGSTVADCLIELESALNGPIADELELILASVTSTDDKRQPSTE
jgi:hypothetical protein